MAAQVLQAALLGLAGAALSGCAVQRSGCVATPSYALAAPTETRLGAQVADQAARHPSQTGFYVLDSNLEAFWARMEMAEAAEKTLDVQSYLIWGDRTGRMLAERILRAADRGVRVRILVDDIHVVWRDSWITRLDAHPNIELRVFNPFLGTRTFAVLVLWDFLEAGRLTRRMHNKLFVTDNAVAIVGGRNIGDEYFAARLDRNFEDLDVLALGPVAQELSRSFDEFWNNEWAYPVARWKSDRERTNDFLRVRQMVERARTQETNAFPGEALVDQRVLSRLLAGHPPPEWAPARVVYDRPSKIRGDAEDGGIHVVPEIWSLVESVRNELLVISPYFVPGERGMALFRKLRQRGVRIRILTNSLGSTDAAIAQTGYARYRRALLAAGVELYELKPSAMSRSQDRRWFRRHATRPQTSLHTKAYVFDRQTLFVGSMNLDNRAHFLNTELGLIVESAVLAEKIGALFEESIQPQHSYRLALEPFQRLTSPKGASEAVQTWPVWITQEKDREVRFTHEPRAGLCRKLMAGFLILLPIEGQL